MLLLNFVLSSFLLSPLLAGLALSDQEHALVESTCLLLPLRELLMALGLGCGVALPHLLNDALALGTLTTVLALLDEVDLAR